VTVKNHSRAAAAWASAIVVLALGAQPSFAQSSAPRSRSLFEGANSDANAKQSLTFAFSAAEAYDDNLEAAGEPRPAIAGFFTSLVPEVRFESRGETVSFGATGGTSLRYYNDLGELIVVNQSAGVGMSAKISRRTGLFVNQAVSYAPSYLYSLFVPLDQPVIGGIIPPATDYSQNPGQVHSVSYQTTARVDQGLTRRSTLSVYSNLRITNYTGSDPGFYDFRALDLGARLSTSLTRDVKLGVDYTYRKTLYSSIQQPYEQNLTFGVEYNLNRAIRAARRTTVAFHLGPAAAWGLLGEQSGLGRYLVIGDAYVAQRFKRTWTARAGYHRGFTYVEGLPNPAFENATSADVSGFFNRRTEFVASLSYSLGETAYLGTQMPFDTWASDAKLRFALSRRVAAFAQVFHYEYSFDKRLPLPPGIANNLTRNGVRVGVTLWVPLMRRN
jgi:hypothetical protein